MGSSWHPLGVPRRATARLWLALLVALVAMASLSLPTPPAEARTAHVPAQFVAKTYTEVLGRAPQDGEWNGGLHHFSTHGCDLTNLVTWALPVYDSRELRSLRYDPEHLALVVYRGVLNRDPDTAGHAAWTSRLAAGARAVDMAYALFHSREFAVRAHKLCTGQHEGWGSQRPMALGPELDGTTLNSMLLAAGPGSVVALEPGTLVRLDAQLIVPPGVTLTTKGVTHRQRYAQMARIVRNRDTWIGDDVFPGWTGDQMVRVLSGGSVRHMWIDGQRNRAVDKEPGTVTLYAELGNQHTVIAHNKVENSPGDQTIKVGDDRYRPGTCGRADVVRNLVTAYSSASWTRADGRGLWTDGIFTQCENSRVLGNEVIDATDVGIIAFRSRLGAVAAKVVGNRVMQAGNNAFGGLVADSWNDGTPELPTSFAGTRFERNVVATSPHTQFVIAIAVGSRPWGLSGVGTGAQFIDNTTGAMGAQATQFLSVNGMRDAVTRGNGGQIGIVGPYGRSGCARAGSVANPPTFATGDLQPHHRHDNDGCVKP